MRNAATFAATLLTLLLAAWGVRVTRAFWSGLRRGWLILAALLVAGAMFALRFLGCGAAPTVTAQVQAQVEPAWATPLTSTTW
jgi:hypothetical protein